MTNAEIVLQESFRLMQEGVLKGSGVYASGIELPEVIHTYHVWRQLGYTVRKGEHAIAKFPIWKHIDFKEDEDSDDGDEPALDFKISKKGRMYLKNASWFTKAQVEPIKEDNNDNATENMEGCC